MAGLSSEIPGLRSLPGDQVILSLASLLGGFPEDFWKREPVIVDDGGAYYLTVQFDVKTGSFMALGFNGYA